MNNLLIVKPLCALGVSHRRKETKHLLNQQLSLWKMHREIRGLELEGGCEILDTKAHLEVIGLLCENGFARVWIYRHSQPAKMLDQTIRLGMKYLEDRMSTRIKSLEERVEKQEAMIQKLLGMLEEAQKKETTKKCRRCGRTGHNIGECYARYHFDGYEIDCDSD